MALSLNANFVAAFTSGRVRLRFRVSIVVEESSGLISSFTNPGTGDTRVIPATAHPFQVGDRVRITGSGSSYYDTPAVAVTVISGSTWFDIDTTYLGGTPGSPAYWYERRTYNFLSGKCDQIAEPESVAAVNPVVRELDPISRGLRSGGTSVVLHRDGLVESLIVNKGLIGRALRVEIGDASLAAADFEPYAFGTVEDYELHDQHVILKVKSSEARLMDGSIGCSHPYNKHPQQILESLCSDYSYYDDTGFDWDADTELSHFVVSRAGVRNYYEDHGIKNVKAAELVGGLCQLIPGSVSSHEDGKLTFKRCDPSSVDDHWTADDYRDFRSIAVAKEWATQVTVKTHSFAGNWPEMAGTPQAPKASFRNAYTLTDEAAQERTAFVLNSDNYVWGLRDKEMLFENHWLSAFAFSHSSMTAGSPGVAGTFFVEQGEVWSMCGSQWPTGYPSGSQDADAQLSGTRTAYLRIDDEIIEVDQLTVSQQTVIQIPDYLASWTSVKVPLVGLYRVKARGALGTTAASHASGAEVRDVTIAVNMANHFLPRLVNGMWGVECRTSFAKWGTQIGDIITFDNDRFIAYGVNGLDSDHKFECIGKKPEGFGGQPSVLWTFAFVEETTPPTPSYEREWPTDVARSIVESLRRQNTEGEASKPKVTDGFGFTDDGGLDGTIAAGTVTYMTGESRLELAVSFTLTASKDSYIGFNTSTSQLFIEEVTLGGSDPTGTAPWATSAPLWKIITDGSDITSTTDLRSSDMLVDSLVTNPSIADDAVTTPKIYDQAVNAAKVLQYSLGGNNLKPVSGGTILNPNARFTQKTRG